VAVGTLHGASGSPAIAVVRLSFFVFRNLDQLRESVGNTTNFFFFYVLLFRNLS
jgi:hypothetical protein